MIILDYRDRRPIYEQIVERFEELMATGALEEELGTDEGFLLPPPKMANSRIRVSIKIMRILWPEGFKLSWKRTRAMWSRLLKA